MFYKTKEKIAGIIAGGSALLMPMALFAQQPDLSYFRTGAVQIGDAVNALVPVLVTISLLVFIWGVIRYTTAGDDEERRKQARQVMIYGIIAVFVVVSIWGIVTLLQQLLGINPTNDIRGPNPPGSVFSI
jgi:uncharacterized membrane protein YidH (DUF202 family)